MDEYCKVNTSVTLQVLLTTVRIPTTMLLTTTIEPTTLVRPELTALTNHSTSNYSLEDATDLLKILGLNKGSKTEDKGVVGEQIDAVLAVVSSISVDTFGNVTELVQTYLSRHVSSLSQFIEFNILFVVLIIGVVCNFINVFILQKYDKQMPPNAKRMNICHMLMETTFLAVVGVLVFMRKYYNQGKHLEAMNYFTCAFGVVWLSRVLLFNYLLSNTTAGVFNIWRSLQSKKKLLASTQRYESNEFFTVLATIAGLCYFSLYLPPVRLFLNENVISHVVCNIPVENYWDLYDMSMKSSSKWFYLLLYPFPFTFFLVILPVFGFTSKNISLVGTIHQICASRYKKKDRGFLNHSVVLSASCNVCTCCLCIKVVPMSLYCFNFLCPFIGNGIVFLTLMNGVGNLLIVAQASSHLLLTLLFNRLIKQLIQSNLHNAKMKVKGFFSHIREELKYYYYLEY